MILLIEDNPTDAPLSTRGARPGFSPIVHGSSVLKASARVRRPTWRSYVEMPSKSPVVEDNPDGTWN